ncbi:hypothetical protein BEP19_13675 [Ammoniphilus oxalaticus]|uniref:Molybdopterin synthase sulfur carrier subunit n=2 Tax=Ammoniphilus oxalaticus TaxID=66863 RepID=A0A419SEY1_9BACL|nr:hypothetical protein BEP19_13675 [Ammoniphilus oxalaticus]
MLFAGLSEVAGSPSVLIETDQQSLSIEQVRAILIEKYPAMEPLLKNSLAAVNQEYADGQQLVSESDEVAFIPPVSGG